MSISERIIQLTEQARLRVHWEYDEFTSSNDYLGSYGNEAKPWCIDRKHHVLLGVDMEAIRELKHLNHYTSSAYRYFYTGNYSPKELENEAYQDYFIADYLSAELWNQGEWSYIGCVCDLEIKPHGRAWTKFLSNAIWGVEDNTSEQHKLNIEEDVISPTKDEFVNAVVQYNNIFQDVLTALTEEMSRERE